MKKALMVAVAGAMVLAFAGPASAVERRAKRAASETGPLIMSAGFGAMASSRRPRSAEICRPVTIRVR